MMTERNGNHAAEITSSNEWRKRSEELALAKTTILELPSGVSVLVRRPPLVAWLRNGKLPETMTKLIARQADEPQGLQTLQSQMATGIVRQSPEDQLAMIRLMQEMVLYAVVKPKLVIGVANSPDEIGLAEVPEEDADFLFEWVMKGSAEVPIPTKEGEVEPQGLANFHTF
jgi:hypothetical protein